MYSCWQKGKIKFGFMGTSFVVCMRLQKEKRKGFHVWTKKGKYKSPRGLLQGSSAQVILSTHEIATLELSSDTCATAEIILTLKLC